MVVTILGHCIGRLQFPTKFRARRGLSAPPRLSSEALQPLGDWLIFNSRWRHISQNPHPNTLETCVGVDIRGKYMDVSAIPVYSRLRNNTTVDH